MSHPLCFPGSPHLHHPEQECSLSARPTICPKRIWEDKGATTWSTPCFKKTWESRGGHPRPSRTAWQHWGGVPCRGTATPGPIDMDDAVDLCISDTTSPIPNEVDHTSGGIKRNSSGKIEVHPSGTDDDTSMYGYTIEGGLCTARSIPQHGNQRQDHSTSYTSVTSGTHPSGLQ